jgi:nicotinate-nucleotide adenylyltransferase
MVLRRVAIYGGTFDPVHNGHLEVARGVLKLFELDEVIFVPACVPPHKRKANITSAFHRFAMLAIATETDQRLLISTIELDSPERPYAVDTVARMKDESRRLFFLIGADSWSEITTWYEWQNLLRMCDLIVVTRPGYPETMNIPPGANVMDVRGQDQQAIAKLLEDETAPGVFITDVAEVDVAATTIRSLTKTRIDDLPAMVPATVANYIKKHRLYRN